MQDSLFSEAALPQASAVRPASSLPTSTALAGRLPDTLRLGTSSWHYPGWAGLVWDKVYTDAQLSRHGLPAYVQHPLFRTVGVDRGFYRPLSESAWADYAQQTPEDFRFVIKAPALVADAMVRGPEGQGKDVNPLFLSPHEAVEQFAAPALRGLGHKLGALVFQISPLPTAWLGQMPRLIAQLHRMLAALPDMSERAPDAVVAVEVRDPHWLTPAFVQVLRDVGATYCLGLHAKMPSIAEQLPVLRALWPGPLVCRWNLNPRHGAYGYEAARDRYMPYNQLVDEDVETRQALARVIAGTASAGHLVYVTLSNKAEGCAPKSVAQLAEAVLAHQ